MIFLHALFSLVREAGEEMNPVECLMYTIFMYLGACGQCTAQLVNAVKTAYDECKDDEQPERFAALVVDRVGLLVQPAVRIFSDNGCTRDTIVRGFESLCMGGHIEIIRELLEKDPSLAAEVDNFTLHETFRRGNKHVVLFLIEYGADYSGLPKLVKSALAPFVHSGDTKPARFIPF